ncbi:MAG: hypothetical protein HY961_04235 [Ignavibacteriae bacterium]|nr:hypothetical protein [Ignavibacteriota bacterium]
MIPHLREYYNTNFTEAKYRSFLKRLDAVCGAHIEFRISETPVFIPSELMQAMVESGSEIVLQLVNNPEYHAAAGRTIPHDFNVPHELEHPMFIAVDFGIVQLPDGGFAPRLIELQGFPTLFAFQPVQSMLFKETFGLPHEATCLLNDMDLEQYYTLFRTAVLGTHDPENVVLMEIDPDRQKTRCDFILTDRICGTQTVNIRDVVKEGSKLLYRRDGRLVPIHRIYNRAIADELSKIDAQLPFSFCDELEVEWAGHPNWFFRISKFSLPFIHHPTVPKTIFLNELKTLPDDLQNWVMKPLFSFAGSGVIVGPTREELQAVPDHMKRGYILQEKVEYGAFVQTPHGGTKAEVRVMFIWPEGGSLTPVANLVRMGRGKMMGVDHNKNMAWVGSSSGLYVPLRAKA